MGSCPWGGPPAPGPWASWAPEGRSTRKPGWVFRQNDITETNIKNTDMPATICKEISLVIRKHIRNHLRPTLAPVELDGSSNMAQILGFIRCQQLSSPLLSASSKPNRRAICSSVGFSFSISSLSNMAKVF